MWSGVVDRHPDGVQGEGEPLVLVPYVAADHACYAFQLPAYTEHFSCISMDLPGFGQSDKPCDCRPRVEDRCLAPAGVARGRVASRSGDELERLRVGDPGP
jgi:pimeloyl-ACP methyl ester carboxylesterase